MAALNLTNDLLAQSEKASQLDSKQTEISSRLADQQTEIQHLHNKVDTALTRLKAKT
jgi:cell division protein ZapA (FtsZ GTPase activity inhibitor)